MQVDIKYQNGKVLARKSSDSGLFALPPIVRVACDQSIIKVDRWVQPSEQNFFFLLNRIVLPYTSNSHFVSTSSSTLGITRRDSDRKNVLLRYENPGVLVARGYNAYFMNGEGDLFAGANVYEEGRLCLGEDFNPVNLSVVDLFLNNQANRDLVWQGDVISGSYVLVNKNYEFNATNWPTWGTKWTLPNQISEKFRALHRA